MRLTFSYGTAASGKLTVARALSALTGHALFHNHLVVDAVGAVFPFGCEEFVRLRERWWLDMLGAAAAAGRSTIFTFMPEPSVGADLPDRVRALVAAHGGETLLVRLTVSFEEQMRRIGAADRAAFGKLTSPDLLARLAADFAAAEAAMPAPALTLDMDRLSAAEAASCIAAQA